MKMYVLVRNDLSGSQKAVQAGHAVAEYLLNFPETSWKNGTLVYLKVRNEQVLRDWAEKLNTAGKIFTTFKEPDRENEITAVATVAEAGYFSNLRLL